MRVNKTSIEGVIFTKIPLRLHLVGLPEILLQSFLLSFVVYHWVNTPDMHWLGMTMWTLFAVALIAPLLGFLKEGMQNQDKRAEPDGAANGNQPTRSEINRTSSGAGSRR